MPAIFGELPPAHRMLENTVFGWIIKTIVPLTIPIIPLIYEKTSDEIRRPKYRRAFSRCMLLHPFLHEGQRSSTCFLIQRLPGETGTGPSFVKGFFVFSWVSSNPGWANHQLPFSHSKEIT
jgi:hypothetical protein